MSGGLLSPSSPAVPRSIAVCGARKYKGELRSVATRRGIKKTSNGSNRVNPLSPCVSVREYRGSAQRARRLEYKKNPRFRLYRAVKSQGRRRKKGEDCPSGASSADPDGDRSDKPKSPITAAALLGSFFSLLRRMNK